MAENELTCDHCGNVIKEDDEYCVNCGSLFADDVLCNNHEDIEASGVCVICSSAFCGKCGEFINKKFLCREHESYEIIDSMVRVFSSEDTVKIEYLKSILENEGLHPFVFKREVNSIPFKGNDYSFWGNPKDQKALSFYEAKIMAPFEEVLKAEEIIAGIENDQEAQ